jgi:hypothetical protein
MTLSEGKLGRAIDGNEPVELAFFGADFRNVDMEIADRMALEGGFGLGLTFELRKPLISWRWNKRCSDDRER